MLGPRLKVETIAVLGAGLMGAGIAQISAEKGMTVLLKDRRDKRRGGQRLPWLLLLLFSHLREIAKASIVY